jgi:hypothetical protein
MRIPSSLKLSVSAISDDAEIVGAKLQRTNVGELKKIDNHVDNLNTQ